MSADQISGIIVASILAYLVGAFCTLLLTQKVSRMLGYHGTDWNAGAVMLGTCVLIWPLPMLWCLLWLSGQTMAGKDWS